MGMNNTHTYIEHILTQILINPVSIGCLKSRGLTFPTSPAVPSTALCQVFTWIPSSRNFRPVSLPAGKPLVRLRKRWGGRQPLAIFSGSTCHEFLFKYWVTCWKFFGCFSQITFPEIRWERDLMGNSMFCQQFVFFPHATSIVASVSWFDYPVGRWKLHRLYYSWQLRFLAVQLHQNSASIDLFEIGAPMVAYGWWWWWWWSLSLLYYIASGIAIVIVIVASIIIMIIRIISR